MVKTKRELPTPRKRKSFSKKCTLDGTISKVVSRPNSATISTSHSQAPSSANMKVIVRVRPPNGSEQSENFRSIVQVVDDQMLIFDPKEDAEGFFFHGIQQKGRDLLKKSHKDMQFVFDKVFSDEKSTEEVFMNSTYSLIESLMDGYNCCVFAYGATGAGKTYTMTGKADNPGITFLTMTELFRKKDELSVDHDFELGITYLEVYNELVKDLLKPGPPLDLREDSKYGVTVSGIDVRKIKKPDELFDLLQQGNKNRTQHPTDANAESSRSHAVFQVYIKMTNKRTKEVRTAKLSMIDLAGSERGSATGFVGARFNEGANINKSLLALGNCINSLADGHRHVPYRNSKLTRLLKDSLGGNCQTVMIANVSPSPLTFEDTYNTLKYATRAKKIKSNMKRNVVNIELHVGQYVKLIDELKQENSLLKKQLEDEKNYGKDNAKKIEELNEEIYVLKNQMKQLSKIQNNVDSEKDNASPSDKDQCNKLNGTFECEKSEMICVKDDLEAECVRLTEKLESIGASIDHLRTENNQSNDTESLGEVDRSVLEKVKGLIKEKREYLERQFQLEKTESGTALRRILKEEVDQRLSDICISSPEKKDVRTKLSLAIERLKKKENAITADLEQVEDCINELEQQLKNISQKYPQVEQFLKEEASKLAVLRLKQRIQLEEKTTQLLLDDQEEKAMLLEKMGAALKKCYMLLQGHGFATDDIIQQYKDVVSIFQGRKNIKWCENIDSGTSSMASIPDMLKEVRSIGNKRKIEENTIEPLEDTFTLPVAFSSRQRKAEQVMTKVLKPPPTKRLANYLTKSPRNKENKTIRRPLDTAKSVAAAKAIVAAKTNSGLRGNVKTPTKPIALTDRPRFKR